MPKADEYSDLAVGALLARWTAQPYQRDVPVELDAFLQNDPRGKTARKILPRARRLLKRSKDWAFIADVASTAQNWSQARRDRIGVELALAAAYLPDDTQTAGDLHGRRVDVCLEAIGASYSYPALLDEINQAFSDMLTDSQSTGGKILTHRAMRGALTVAGLGITALTGIGGLGAGLKGAHAVGTNLYQSSRTRTLEEFAYVLAVTARRITCALNAHAYDHVNELRYGLDDVRARIVKSINSDTPERHASDRLRMLNIALTEVDAATSTNTSNRQDLAPELRFIRLDQARRTARSKNIHLRTSSQPDTIDPRWRPRRRPAQWTVTDQWPPPRYYLTQNREVLLIIRHTKMP